MGTAKILIMMFISYSFGYRRDVPDNENTNEIIEDNG
jgi:hypothetical protein